MINVLLVGLGGFIGAIIRYLLSIFIVKTIKSDFPVATLTINFIGAFIIGIVLSYSNKATFFNENLLLFLTIGVLGGFTTFSTFSAETINLFENGKILLAFTNIISSITLCLFGVLFGKFIINSFFK